MNIKSAFLILVSVITVISCNDEVVNTYAAKPVAMGRLNDLVVIADDDLWQGMPGDTFRHYFESAYPIMPNPEPMFDIRHFTSKELRGESLRKELRTYVILADLADNESQTSKMVRKDIGEERYIKAKKDGTFVSTVGKDKWARGQIVVYLFGKDEKTLANAIKEKFSPIAERVRQHDEEQLLASIYTVKGQNAGASARVKKHYELDMKVPGDYEIALDDQENNILWLRRDDSQASGNIVLREYDYKDQDQLSKENLIAIRDEYGKQFISGPGEGSYMVTNAVDLPVYEYTYDISGLYTKEIRGIWEMEKEFMGGPFISYALLDNERGKLIFIDTFIYAPGQDKRDMMQQIEYIIKHVKVSSKDLSIKE